jgi:GTPase Era involved in 16S rRNA processing
MKRKYIPIIGTISAGKSTFLRAFLGTNLLQTGASTTTRFICLIKNSDKTCFYHVLPNTTNGIEFYKDGEVITEEDQIKIKIENINDTLSEKKSTTKDEIFYMLETPIKNINNIPLLENCYFMDIPGLNENGSTYIQDIFSLITYDDILFEIFVFDSTSIGSDNILDIFKDLYKRNCLKTEGNFYILNKIDQCTKGGQGDIIDAFTNYFYKEFEDEKIKDSSKIKINFSHNFFVPMNSLLYEAETKIKEDFYSMLIFELFTYLEYNNNSEDEISTFVEYLQKRVESLVSHYKIDFEEIEKKSKKIKDNDIEMINIISNIEKLKKIINVIKKKSDFQLGIRIENQNIKSNNVKKVLKNLFLIHKEKNYYFIHTEFYMELQNKINSIILVNNKDDMCSPPSAISKAKIEQNNINQNSLSDSNIDNPYLVINELDDFINETFKIIDPNNEMPEFKLSLQTLRENILGRKIRIAFIGNISVGKSTVLNCIIGKDILPTKETECTYRGVIIRYKNIDSFELYRTKLISKGKGLNQYYYFIDQDKPYYKGIKNIKHYLNNINNDKIIKDEDAYIVIAGRLKIFNFIKLDENLINKIEFIDLPGLDRKENTFNDNKYYEKILKFSNVCVYINEPKSINDKNSVLNMIERFSEDKKKVFPNLRPKFIKTCLFLINKSDTLSDDSDKEKTIKNFIKNFPPEEKVLTDNINISFFSGQSFFEYIDIYNRYVESFDINPTYFFKLLYDEWAYKIYIRNFAYYIKNRICGKIEEKLDLDLEEDINIDKDFYNKMKNAINQIYEKEFKGISYTEEEEIIQKLYNLYYSLKNHNFDGTIYSHEFFGSLKNVILYSENLHNENLKNALNQFFTNADELFNKEKEKDDEKQIKDNKEKCNFIKYTIIPKTNQLFLDKEKAIINIFDLGKYRCLDIIDDEIKNNDDRLKENNNDVEKAARKLEEKIKEKIDEVNKEQEKEVNSIIKEIENLLKDKLNEYYEKKEFSKTNINTNRGLTMKMVISLFTSAVSGIAVRSGLVVIAEAVIGAAAGAGAAGAGVASSAIAGALLGPAGVLIGLGVGVAISVSTFLFHWFNKTKRYISGLEESRTSLSLKFDEIKSNFTSDFKIFRESVINELNVKLEIISKDINKIDKKKWEEIKKNYLIQKKIIEKMIMNKLKD